MLMQDNVRPHIVRIVQQYRHEVGIRAIVWPARSLDLNLIVPKWDIVERRLRRLLNPSNTLDQLFLQLVEIWD